MNPATQNHEGEPVALKADVPDAKSFRNVVGHFSSGVTIITVRAGERRSGATASAFCSLSLDPPMVLVCLSSDTDTARAVSEAKHFVVNILAEDQAGLALHFASRAPDKYSGLPNVSEIDDQPALADTLSQLRCRVVEVATGGTHSVFLAQVEKVRVQQKSPLAYYRGTFGKFVETRDDGLYRQVKSAILDRKYSLSDALTPQLLSQDFESNGPPLTQALLRLCQEGLLVRDGWDAYRITPINEAQLTRALDARRALTVGVLSTTMPLSGEQIADIRQAALATKPDVSTSAAQMASRNAVHAFHQHVVALASNSVTTDLYLGLNVPNILSQVLGERDWTPLQEQISLQFCRLAEALEKRSLQDAILAVNAYSKIAADECVKFLHRVGGNY